jgi:glycerophosphoryl diester phosphodiesterase
MSRSFFAMSVSPNIIHPYLADVNPKYVAKEHKRGRRVHTWTVNYEDDVRRVVSAGVDGIFTDNPKATREIMESMLK